MSPILSDVESLPFAVFERGPALRVGGRAWCRLLRVDLQSGTVSALLRRQTPTESLDVPALWPDGYAVLFERSDLSAALRDPGQATPQFRSGVEQLAFDGSAPSVVVDAPAIRPQQRDRASRVGTPARIGRKLRRQAQAFRSRHAYQGLRRNPGK
jgi:hypothetical protein